MPGYSRIMIVAIRDENALGHQDIMPQVLLLIGEGNRQWVEARYLGDESTALPHPRVIVPEGPDHPDMVLDACLAFLPAYFSTCPSYPEIQRFLSAAEHIDFNADRDEIPPAWVRWREEARSQFSNLLIQIVRIDNVNKYSSMAEFASLIG